MRLQGAIFVGVMAALTLQGFLIHYLTFHYQQGQANASAENALQLARRTLNNQVEQLGQLAADNTIWEELYAATGKNDQTWLRENIFESKWTITPTIIAVVDERGRVLGTHGPLAEEARRNMRRFPCIGQALTDRQASGLYTINDRLTIVSASPVHDGQGKGDLHGVLMFARYVDNDMVAILSKWTGMPVVLASSSQVLAGSGLPRAVTQAKLENWHTNVTGVTVDDLGDGRYAAVGPVADATGERVATLAVVYKEPGFAVLATINGIRIWLAPILAIVLALLIGIRATQLVCEPLSKFAMQADRLSTGDLTARMEDTGTGDAFDSMSHSFNKMAEELSEAFEKMEHQNIEIETQLETMQVLNERMLSYSSEVQDLNERLQWQNSQLEALNMRLSELAHTDGVTGLHNHRSFHDRLAHTLAEAQRYGTPLSVIMMDVDHFKKYNDRLGHPAGDVALREVARVIREHIRETDFAARYGGEEFAVGLPQTDIAGAEQLAERIRLGVQNLLLDGNPITISAGVATLTERICTAVDMVVAADNALYIAKGAGRNRVVSEQETRKTA